MIINIMHEYDKNLIWNHNIYIYTTYTMYSAVHVSMKLPMK